MSAAPTTSALGAVELLDGVVRPTKRNEAWRYAPHRELDALIFGPSGSSASAAVESSPAGVPAELLEQIPTFDGPRVVVVNGAVDRTRSDFSTPVGVLVATLADAAQSHPDLVHGHVDRADLVDAFTAYNLVYGTDGAVIVVDAGAHIAEPIHVVDIALPAAGANTSSTGVVIRLGAGSSATVVETRLGVGAGIGGSNVRTTISLGDDATLEHILVQDLPANQIHLGRVEAVQGERSTLRTRAFNLGASYGRLAYHVELDGVGAHADLSGLYFGVGEQTLDQQITVVHRAKDCTSRQLFRGVLDDASTGVFNGGIDVCPGADGTDAEQSNDNLLLSNRAEVNTQPRLEILADEVACKHGATVGQLDDTALYYLRSRGINADEARRLLINGFADEVVDDVSVESLRTWITHRLGHDYD
jgi:Fe-S cluster assembly protein SufD